MANPTPTPEQIDVATYAAWQRMRSETRAIIAGSKSPEISQDLPHVSAWLARRTRYLAEFQFHSRSPEGLRAATQLKLEAEARYVEALIPAELERAMRTTCEG